MILGRPCLGGTPNHCSAFCTLVRTSPLVSLARMVAAPKADRRCRETGYLQACRRFGIERKGSFVAGHESEKLRATVVRRGHRREARTE
jgi:hypothetical protein